MKLLKIALLLALFLAGSNLFAQVKVSVNGRVLDEKNLPLPGATIIEPANPKNAVAADINGNFRLTVSSGHATIKISAVGYVSSFVELKGRTTITVSLHPDQKGLEDVVVRAYSTQKKITATGASSTIKAAEVADIPTSSIQNTLVGRLPGFFSMQRSGQPGSSAADFYIRGQNSLNGDAQPLIIVDDIEYTYAQVSQMDVNEIESVTILKDASTTAVYGIKGANGVLIITTKRGKIGTPRINVRAESGIDKVIKFTDYSDAYTTAVLLNEAYINDSYGLATQKPLPYTAADLAAFKYGTDPYGHPNVNWQQALLNNYSTQQTYNVDISGGNSTVKYMTSLGYFTQDGILKHFAPIKAGDDVDNNYFYNRFNFRSNLDVSPTKTLNLQFDINGRFEVINNPAGIQEGSGLFKELEEFRSLAPMSTPLRFPNGSYGYSNQPGSNGFVNPIVALANGGYNRNFNNNFNIAFRGNQKLNFIAQGLEAKVVASYASNINEHRNETRGAGSMPVYNYNPVTNTYALKSGGSSQLFPYGQGIGNDAFNNTIILQGQLHYNRQFGDHNIDLLGVVNQNSYINGGNVSLNYRGISGTVNYNYKQKYILNFAVARNGNDVFNNTAKYGVFPAGSAAWNISEEKFFKKAFPFFDLFKIKGSFGTVGSDVPYINYINKAGLTSATSVIPYSVGGSNVMFGSAANEGALVNPNITWEIARKTDVGMELSMFNGKLTIDPDYFHEYRYHQIIAQGDVPLLIGQALPQKNIGITSNTGFDGDITYRTNFNNVRFAISANYSHAKNKIVYISEAPDYPYQAQTGRQIGLTKGYHFVGFYQTSDFDANGQLKAGVPHPLTGTTQPGDLKYADLNHDGLITNADMTFLSKPNLPTDTYGLNLSVGYKGFSLQALFQGAFGYAVQINYEGSDAFNGNIRPWFTNAWTPYTAATATYPRITFNSNPNDLSGSTVSDFWFQDGKYVRLKSLELSYQIPQQWLHKLAVRSARIYVSGYDLLTFRNTGKFDIEPEIGAGQGYTYPLTANYYLGVQLGF